MGHQDPVWNQVRFVLLPGQTHMQSYEHHSIVGFVHGVKRCSCTATAVGVVLNVCLSWYMWFRLTSEHVANDSEDCQVAQLQLVRHVFLEWHVLQYNGMFLSALAFDADLRCMLQAMASPSQLLPL